MYMLVLLSTPIPELLYLAEFLSQDRLDAFDPEVAGGIVCAGYFVDPFLKFWFLLPSQFYWLPPTEDGLVGRLFPVH